jgi:diacylglycerol O-acyltransferase / wax synthase
MTFFERLSALDASFLEVEDATSHMHVGAVLLFDARPLLREDGGLDIARIEALIGSRLHAFPRYRQRLRSIPIENHPVWIDDPDFNLHYHVRHTGLPPPGEVRQLKRLVGRIMSQQLDRGKPLWEAWVVEGIEGQRFAVVTKVHHCMVDGIAGVELLNALMRPQPEVGFEVAPRWRPRPAPSDRELVWAALRRRAAEPAALLDAGRRALRDPLGAASSVWERASAIEEVFAAGLEPAADTPLNAPRIGPHRRFDWVRFDLDAVKDIKSRLGGTVNDVVLATVAGALGDFLRHRGVRGIAKLPFRAMVPVNLRRRDERGSLGNRVGQLLAPLPVAERDPVRRLRRVVATTQQLKHSKQTLAVELLEEIGDWTATGLITQVVRLQARVRSYNLVVTNVPGPAFPLYLLEAPLLEIYPVVPLFANQGLGVALFSYSGGLYWGLNSDWDRIPDLHELADGLALHFEELSKAAAAAPARRSAPAPPGT